MANEITKITDQNGVEHPLVDVLGREATVDLLKDTTGWLGGNEWNIKDPNIIYDLSTGLTYSVLEKGYQVSNSTAAEWASLKMFFASRLKANTDYKLSTDISIASGTARIIVSGSTSQGGTYTQIVDSQNITASGKAVVDFNTGNYTWLRIVIYSTVGTSTTGNVTYDNFMITTPEQYALNPSYRPYHVSVAEMLAYSSELLTTENTNISIDTGAVYKWGRVVNLFLMFKCTTTTPDTDEVLFTLPAKYRPSALRIFRTYDVGTSATTERHQVTVNSDGVCTLKILDTHDAGRWIRFEETFISAS